MRSRTSATRSGDRGADLAPRTDQRRRQRPARIAVAALARREGAHAGRRGRPFRAAAGRHRQRAVRPHRGASRRDLAGDRGVDATAATAQHFDPEPFERIEARITSLAQQIEELVEDRPGRRSDRPPQPAFAARRRDRGERQAARHRRSNAWPARSPSSPTSSTAHRPRPTPTTSSAASSSVSTCSPTCSTAGRATPSSTARRCSAISSAGSRTLRGGSTSAIRRPPSTAPAS